MVTRGLGTQRGFILVTLIFLVLVGVLLIAGMAFLYNTADTQQSLQNGGAQAFVTAESGDQYGVYWLETNYTTTPLTTTPTTVPAPPVPPLPAGAGAPDCYANVTITDVVQSGGDYVYTVTSVVPACAGSGASRTVVRTVTGVPPGATTLVCKIQGSQKKPKHPICKKVKNKSGTVSYTTTGWAED